MSDAERVRPLVRSGPAKAFLDGARLLPDARPLTLYLRKSERRWITAEEYARLDPAGREGFEERRLDENFYFETRYGSPVAYARALDVIGSCGAEPPMVTLNGARIMDFGCGGLGPARMMAAGGARVLGVDVDPMLGALYSRPEDQGAVPTLEPGGGGSIRLALGNWPASEDARKAVAAGGPYDLIISKNTLKAGYVHPSRDVDPRMLLNLEVSDEAFVKALFDALAPGGLAVIYNICPAPAGPGEKYIPWAEGRCPFAREVLEKQGFRVLKFDEADDDAARAMFEALGYPTKKPDTGEDDIFAWFTIAQRPA